MNIENRAAKTLQGLFTPFKTDISFDDATSAVCIALQNFGGEDTRAVYEIYIAKQPHFFAVSNLEYDEDDEAEVQYTKTWTEAEEVKLIDKYSNDYSNSYLFELQSPFGIHFS